MKKAVWCISLIGIFLTACTLNDTEGVYLDHSVYSIFKINTDGSGLFPLINKEYFTPPSAIYFTENDTKILILITLEKGIRELDLNSMISKYYTFDETKFSALSRDRTQLALVKNDFSDQDIYIFNLNSKSFTKVTNTPTVEKRELSFSNDGSKIVYSTRYSDYSAIETVNLTTGMVTEVARTTSQNITGMPLMHPIYNYNDSEVFYFLFENKANYINHICRLRSNHNYVIDDTTNANGGLTLSGSNGFIIYDEMESYPWRLISHNLTLNKRNILGDINYVGVTVSVSNDGLKVLYGFTGSYSYEDIILVNIDGSNKKYLSKGQMPFLSSDGQKATFVLMEKVRDTN